MATTKPTPEKAPEATTAPAPATPPEPDETTPAEDVAPEKAPVLDPALVERYDLPQEYVDAVNAGLQSPPPRVEQDADTELHFEGNAWVNVPKGSAPGGSTAISR